jgi:hypothetical protein
LLILDNLEALTPKSLAELLTAAQAWAKAGNSRLLMTTRQNDLAHPAFPTENSSQHRYLSLRGLGQEDALAYFQTLQKLPPEPLFKQPEREALSLILLWRGNAAIDAPAFSHPPLERCQMNFYAEETVKVFDFGVKTHEF